MRKLALTFALLAVSLVSFAQSNRVSHTINDDFILYIDDYSHHGDCLLSINSKEISNGYIVSYYYVGIDNNHNLILRRSVYNVYKNKISEEYNLTFAMDDSNNGDITLLGLRSRKNPVIVQIKVTCDNHRITSKYIPAEVNKK